jgi:hypothetical protein
MYDGKLAFAADALVCDIGHAERSCASRGTDQRGNTHEFSCHSAYKVDNDLLHYSKALTYKCDC